MSLSSCAKEAAKYLPSELVSSVLARAKKLRDQGMTNKEASRQAATEAWEARKAKLEDRLAEVTAGPGEAIPDTVRLSPERLVREDPFEMSTRAPSTKGKKLREDPMKELLISDFASGLTQPKWIAAVADMVTKYPNYRDTASADTPAKQLERLVRQMADNLVWLHDQVPVETRQRSKLWYDGANTLAHKMAKAYELKPPQAAGILAVLSPQKDWFMNVSLAMRVARTMALENGNRWTQKMDETAQRIFGKAQYQDDVRAIRGTVLGELGDDLYLQAMWLRTFDEAHNSRAFEIVSPEGKSLGNAVTKDGVEAKVAWGGMNTIAKAISIYHNGSIENIHAQLGTKHKVRNFYNNILVPNSKNGHVTIDTHAVAAGQLRALSGNSLAVKHNFGGVSNADMGLGGTYALYEEAYRRAAERLGILPRELQSITWEAIRGMFRPTFKSQATNVAIIDKIWKNFKEGRLSHDAARELVRDAAGGIDPPSWLGRNPAAYAEDESSADEGDLDGDELAGGDPEDDARAGAGDSKAVSREVKRSPVRAPAPWEDDLEKLLEDVNATGVELDAYASSTRPDTIAVGWIGRGRSARGMGGEALDRLGQFADAHDLFIALTALDGEPGLVKFYQRHGFKVVDATDPEEPVLVREPQDVKRSTVRTVQVDGVRHPDTDSKGHILAPAAGSGMQGQINFWRWFRGSKVVDAQGRPLVVYHGTTADFAEFKTDSDLGAHFGDIAQANMLTFHGKGGKQNGDGGNVMPVYLRIKNPLRLEDHGDFYADNIVPQLARLGVTPEGGFRPNQRHDMTVAELQKMIESHGYDGIVYLNKREVSLENEQDAEDLDDAAFKAKYPAAADSFIAFHPEQVKSAIGNNGQFDPATGDITQSPARWSDNRISILLDKYAYPGNGQRTKAYAGWVSPKDFIDATTPDSEMGRLREESRPLDPQRLATETQEIFLQGEFTEPTEVSGIAISPKFKITGHEGRHRMLALRDAGIDRVPVSFVVRHGHDAQVVPAGMYVAPQEYHHERSARGFIAGEFTPITYDNRALLKKEFGGQADVTFSPEREPRAGVDFFEVKVAGGKKQYGLFISKNERDQWRLRRVTKAGDPFESKAHPDADHIILAKEQDLRPMRMNPTYGELEYDDDVRQSPERDDETPKSLEGFHKKLGMELKAAVEYGQMLARQHDWMFNVGEVLYSKKTGKTYNLVARSFSRVGKLSENKWEPVYWYSSGPEGEEERGTFPEKRIKEVGSLVSLTTPKMSTTRRGFLMGAAAALASTQVQAGQAMGKAKPISAEVMGARVSPEVEQILRGVGKASDTPLKAAMRLISASGPKELRPLASQIEQLLPEAGLQLKVDDVHRLNLHGGTTLGDTPTVTLYTADGRTGLTYDTLMHESLHGAIAARYRSLSVGIERGNDRLIRMSTPEAKAALAQWRQLWEEFVKAAEKDQALVGKTGLALRQSMENPDEFFVRSLTDPNMQQWLAKNEYQGTTLWKRFTDWVTESLLGFKRGTAPSWLDAALQGSGELMQSMREDAPDFSRLRAVNRFTGQHSLVGEAKFSPERPQFYSQLERVVEAMPERLATMAAPQWKLWLDANAAKAGVKKDEIEWSGIKDWLELRGKDKTSKDEVAQFLRGNGIRVSDVKLAGEDYEPNVRVTNREQVDPTLDEDNYDEDGGEYLHGTPMEEVTLEDKESGRTFLVTIDHDAGNVSVQDQDNGGRFVDVAAPMNRQNLGDAIAAVNELLAKSRPDNTDGPAEYHDYVVPGGENYREVLLTLPPAEKKLGQWRVMRDDGVSDGIFATEEQARARARDIGGYLDEVQPQPLTVETGYRSGHWGGKYLNTVAHLRVDDRTDAEGKKVLFINEIQSDWAQDGRKKGFGEPKIVRFSWQNDDWVRDDNGTHYGAENGANGDSLYNNLADAKAALKGKPKAPFVTDTKAWVALAIKRALMLAVEGGHDKVAFITGGQAADLYKLSLHVKQIRWNSVNSLGGAARDVVISMKDDNVSAITMGVKEDGTVSWSSNGDFKGKRLDDIIGKGVADRIMSEEQGLLKDEGLKIGGEGMHAFYDTIVPQVANDVLKKLGGGKVGEVQLSGAKTKYEIQHDKKLGMWYVSEPGDDENALSEHTSEEEAKQALKTLQGTQQPAIEITPELREKVSAGVPLFSTERDPNTVTLNIPKVDTSKQLAFIQKVYQQLPANPMNPAQRFMKVGDDQWGLIELGPRGDVPGAIDVKWFQAMPQGEGVGAKAMKRLQEMAAADGMPLTLWPWDKGRVSQAKLVRFYKSVGFEPIRKGGKQMVWYPEGVKQSPDRDENLKTFLGSTKIRNEDGTPKVLYHMTPENFKEFKPGGNDATRSGTAIWLSGEAEYQAAAHNNYSRAGTFKEGVNVMPVYVRMERPLLIDDPEMLSWARTVFADGSREFPQLMPPKWVENVTRDGEYDGIIFRGPAFAGGSEREDEYIVFDPKQLKSAIGNDGSFDRSSPDITQSPARAKRYLRIGQLPEGERSSNFSSGKKEDGVSVYELDSNGAPIAPPDGEWAEDDMRDRLSSDAPKHIVEGDEVGRGGDGEPLLRNVRIVGDFDPSNPDITQSTLRAQALPFGYQVADLLDSSKQVSWWDKTVGTPYHLAQKYPAFKRVYDAVQAQISDVSRYATRAADLAPTILPKLDTLADIAKSPLSAADVQALADPIFKGTVSYTRDAQGKPVETQDVGSAGVVWTNDELRDMWHLDDRQMGLYREFRKSANKSIADMAITGMLRLAGRDGEGVTNRVLAATRVDEAASILADHLSDLAAKDPERANTLQNTARMVGEIRDQARGLIARGYAPLQRFGQHTVYAPKLFAHGYFEMFETEREANKRQRELKALFPNEEVTTGTMSQESWRLFKGVTPEALALFGEALGLDESATDQESQVFQEYLKMAKSTRSAMKRLIERKGVEGYSQDVGRVLAGFVYSNARLASQNLNAKEMLESANAIPEKQGDLRDHAIKLVEYAQNPSEEAPALRGLLFMNYIGGSVASAITNLTQSLTTTLPTLSMHFGIGKAGSAMAGAIDIAKNGAGSDADLAAAMKRAEEEGVTAPQEVHHLMAQAQGKGTLKSGDGTLGGDLAAKGSNAWSKAMLVWGKMFGWAELVNRKVAFAAAYKLAREKGMADPYGFAKQIVSDTQFTMNKGNNPQWARGPVGATLFTFKKFGVMYLEGLARMYGNGPEGKKAFALSLGIMFLLAGAGGFPFADDLDDLIDGFAQRVLGKSFSSKLAKKQFFAGILGEAGADFVEGGISGVAGFPIDFSGRLGMGNLIPGTGLLVKKDNYGRDIAEIAGAAGDFAKRVAAGGAAAAQGDVRQAVLSSAPTAVTNALQAADMWQLGYYRDAAGRKVIDTTKAEAALKAIGFQPQTVHRIQEATGIEQEMIGLNKVRETEIANLWAAGRIERDQSKIDDAKAQLKAWNESNPDSPISIDASQINKRVQQAMMNKAQRMAKTAPKELRKGVAAELKKAMPDEE